MSSRPSWQDILQLTAKARGIEFSPKDAEEIRKSADDSPLALWVLEILNSSNSLTAEEIEIWEHMQKRKFKQSSEVQDELPSVPRDEASLQKAIAALEASTKTAAAQLSILQQQKSLLATYQSRHGLDSTQNTAFQTTYERKQQIEAQQLKFHNAELSTSLNSDLRATQEKIEKTIRALPFRTTERLRSDDRTFESLNTLTNTTTNTDKNHDITRSSHSKLDLPSHKTHLTALLSALTKATALQTLTHLDRIYLSTLHAPPPANLERVHESEISHLQGDLDSLHSEISSISAMLVRSQHGAFLEDITHEIELKQNTHAAQDTIVAHETIETMTNQLLEMDERVKLLNSHRMVIDEIETHLTRLHAEAKSQSQSQPQASTTRPAQNPPVPSPPTTTSTPALTALLQNLNLNHSLPPSNSNTNLPNKPLTSTLQSLISQIHLAIQTIQPNIHYLLGVNNPSSSPYSSLSTFPSTTNTTSTFSKEIQALQTLEEKVSRAKAAVEVVAARDDEGARVRARMRFVREGEGRG